MKKWIKKVGQNKFQFFFFVGILVLLFVALILASTMQPVDTPPDDDPTGELPIDKPDDNKPVVEVLKLPFDETMSYKIVRKFYERDASQEDQEKALIKYGKSYRTSVGTSYARIDENDFDILSAMSGKVVQIVNNPLFGTYVVVEHKDNVKTYYYGLSEVSVTVDSLVKQGDKLGVSGNTEIDQSAGNHVYFKVIRGNRHINPEKAIGKKTSEL